MAKILTATEIIRRGKEFNKRHAKDDKWMSSLFEPLIVRTMELMDKYGVEYNIKELPGHDVDCKTLN